MVPAIFVGILAFLAAIYFTYNYQKALCYRQSKANFGQIEKVRETLPRRNYLFQNEFSENNGMNQE